MGRISKRMRKNRQLIKNAYAARWKKKVPEDSGNDVSSHTRDIETSANCTVADTETQDLEMNCDVDHTTDVNPATPTNNIADQLTNNINETSGSVPTGRRILSVESLLSAIKEITQHSGACSLHNFAFNREERVGVQTGIFFTCQCGFEVNISSDSGNESLHSSRALSFGCQLAPIGFSAVTKLLAVLDIPSPSKEFYGKCQEKTFEDILMASTQIMSEAAKEEKRLAEEAGDFVEIEEKGEDGEILKRVYPWIMVIVDGGWSKRTYGHSYDASSGVAVVIGARTRKIVSFKTRNKTCQICTRARNKGICPRKHDCYKDYSEPSTKMEADILYDCFMESIPVHGLVYKKFVGDGDSAVHSKVRDVYPGIIVEKIECMNHAMKNFHKRLFNISDNKVTGVDIPQHERKIVGIKEKFDRIGKGIMSAIIFHSCNRHDESWKDLRDDIMNSMYHVFGQHDNCRASFCPPDSERRKEQNLVPTMSKKVFWGELQKPVQRLANISKSLIERKTTNPAEAFMSTCNRYMEGKRKNLSQRFLYMLRMHCAAISYNTTTFWGVEAYKAIYNRSPGPLWEKIRLQSINARSRAISKRCRRRPALTFLKPGKGDKYYGSNPERPDISNEELRERIAHLRNSLQVTPEQQSIIEQSTRDQANSPLWFQERRPRITASVCGEIFRRRPKTNNTGILNKILRRSRTSAGMQYGKETEAAALEAYSQRFPSGFVRKAGLVVSLEDGIYAASPDGFVGDEGLVEIKCPYSFRDSTAENWEPIRNNSGEPKLKRNHKYFYQVVQQLHVTGRKWCDFFVYTPHYTYCERIVRDESTLKIWESIKTPVGEFWDGELAAEIVDSRFERNMPYRCPPERIGKPKVLKSLNLTMFMQFDKVEVTILQVFQNSKKNEVSPTCTIASTSNTFQ